MSRPGTILGRVPPRAGHRGHGQHVSWTAATVIAMWAGAHVGPIGCRPSSADPAPLVDAGLAAVGRGDHAAARRAMRDLRTAGATDASFVVQAAILVAKGHPIPALDVLPQTAVADWLEAPRRLVAATASQQLGRHRDVEALLAPLVAVNPDMVDAHRLLAVSFYDVGAVQEAVHHLRETARLAPDDPRPHRLLGLMHSDYELFAEAIPCYEESLRRDPHQPDREDILLELATCLIRQLRPADALDVLSTAAAGVRVDLARAECLLALGRREEARRLVQSAVAAEPDNRAALVLEGSILLEDGDAEAAVIPLERAVAVDPHDYLATLSLARALAQLGRENEATATRARADEIRSLRSTFAELHREAWERPHDSEVRQRLADTAARLGREDLERVWREAAAAVATDAPTSTNGPPERSQEAD